MSASECNQVRRLVRRGRLFRRLDVVPPVPCECGFGHVVVIDHHYPMLGRTGRSWRYEVTCDECMTCDPNGYQTQADVLAAIAANAKVSGGTPYAAVRG
jgi:hypothetical protein